MAERDEGWTILKVLTWTSERFARARIGSPRLDAELLLAHLLRVDRVRLYMDFDKPLCAGELGRYRQLVQRRLAREPVAYIVGEREFWSLPLFVDRAAIVPRPETELLVELALELSRAIAAVPLTVVDVGTGCGAIAVALKRELPDARVIGTDIGEAALELARRNATRHGVAIDLYAGDLLEALPDHTQPNLVVGNLPYVASAELETLEPELRAWEPRVGLDGGVDGLVLVRRLVEQAALRLAAGGALALEIGWRHGPAVRSLLEAHGFLAVEVRRDLAGLDRVVSGRRSP